MLKHSHKEWKGSFQHYLDGIPDHYRWTNSKNTTNYTKELPEYIVKLMSVPKGKIDVEFHGKNKQHRKIKINLQFSFSWTEFYELFDGKPC